MSKHVRRSIITLIVTGVILFIVDYVGERLPIISGYAAKGMCSGVFVAGRNPNSVSKNDLGFFPISLAKTQINYIGKYVTSTVFGMAQQKAVFRDECGCSLVIGPPAQVTTNSGHNMLLDEVTPENINWPSGDKLSDTVIESIQIEKLKQLLENVVDKPGQERIKQTAAVVVVYKDKLIAEKYADGFTSKTRFLGWSMTKSITNALVGILVKQNKLKINSPVSVKGWSDVKRSKITLNNLLHMNSGLKWTEDYFNLSDVTKMLYKSDNMYDYAINAKCKYSPDSIWCYSSGTPIIVSGIIRNTFKDEASYIQFPYEALFKPVHLHSMLIETDASGTFVSSSYSFATARDWARFGMLYLNDGVWQGKRILPEGWVAYTTTPAKGSDGKYGAFFWLNKNKFLPDVPDDAFYCDGFHGQRVFIIPSRQLVIVRLGFSGRGFDFNGFVSSVISTLPAN